MKLPSRARVRPNSKMSIPAPASRITRRRTKLSAALLSAASVAALCGLCARVTQAQPAQQPQASQLPATAPTSLSQQSTATCAMPPCAATTPDGPPKPTRPHHASVTFASGQLTVAANDSSLHQILRSISTETGMKITGGVEEQRVFGTYGPSDPATILATLLDGTGVNMLLTAGPGNAPATLLLTPRSGGPPSSPITAEDEKIGADELSVVPAPAAPAPVRTAPTVASTPAPQTVPTQAGQPQPTPAQSSAPAQQIVGTPSTPVSIPQPANNVLGSPNNVTPTASQIPTTNSVPVDALPTPSTTVQTQQGIVDTPNPPPAGSAPTPDSIYQQLLQLQKAKDAAAANPSATPPASAPPPATPPQ